MLLSNIPIYAEPLFVGVRVVLMVLVSVFGLIRLCQGAAAWREVLAVVSLLILWCVVTWSSVRFGVYRPILLPFFLAVPLTTALLLARSQSGKRFVDTVPQQGLVGIQAFRIVGGSFLLLWSDGLMTGLFAIPVGLGDLLIGVSAVFLSVMIARDSIAHGDSRSRYRASCMP